MPAAPEYAITKPGMPSQQRKFVRTYGRRTASTPESRGEPPAKKRKASPIDENTIVVKLPLDDPRLTSDSDEVAEEEEEEEEEDDDDDEALAEVQQPKSSILNYFRPVRPSTPNKKETLDSPPSPPLSDVTVSPLVMRPKRKRAPRLLRLRPPAQLSSEDSLDDNDRPDTPSSYEETLESKNTTKKTSLSDKERGSTQKDIRTTFTELNSAPDRETNRPKLLRKHTIQTTLNISARAKISECKLCDTVWNPFYPDDVKFHKQRHAAMLRAQKKEIDLL